MKQYLLSVYSPEGGTPPAEVLDSRDALSWS
jgi:hypothetical protein